MYRYGYVDENGNFSGEFYCSEIELVERLQRKISVLPVIVNDEAKDPLCHDRLAPDYVVVDGKIVETFSYVIKADVAEALRKHVDVIRQERERQGLRWSFDGTEDVVQLRNETDARNINAQVVSALVLQGHGVTDAVLPFRAASDATYMMTPAAMVAMGMAVSKHISVLYECAWGKKAEIDVLEDDPEAVIALDLNEGWPL